MQQSRPQCTLVQKDFPASQLLLTAARRCFLLLGQMLNNSCSLVLWQGMSINVEKQAQGLCTVIATHIQHYFMSHI